MENQSVSIFNDYGDGESRLLRVVKSALPGLKDNEQGILVQMQVLRPQPVEPLPVSPMHHVVHDTQSFLDWLKFNGAKEQTTLICWDENSQLVKAVLDTDKKTAIPSESIANNPEYGSLPTCKYKLTLHRYFETWQKKFHNQFTHKELIQFLLRNQADIKDASEFIEAWKKLKTAMTVDVDAQYSDGHTMMVNFTSDVQSGKTATAELPRYFILRIPVLASDDEPVEFYIDVEIGYPERATDKPTFGFYCRDFDDAVRVAMKKEIQDLRKALAGYTILYGSI